jgi:GDPmannose 4,6-dehydratase
MKTAIITGITGQDGSYLAHLLVEKGYSVVGTTRSYTASSNDKLKYLGIASQVKIEEADLLDVFSIIKLFNKYQPDEIYNLAAQSSVGLSFEQPIGTLQFNISSVLNLLEAIRLVNPKIKFYQASSSEMFGKVNQLPINEHTPLHPLSPYAISKATAYWTVVNYRESYGLFACNGILFNHESYLRSNNFFVKKVIRESIAISKNKQQSLKVGNIEIKRDFGYTPAYVKAMWLLLQHHTAEDITICSGKSIFLKDIIYYIFDKLSVSYTKLEIDKTLFRPVDIEDMYGDNTKAKNVIGWDYHWDFFKALDLILEEELLNFN